LDQKRTRKDQKRTRKGVRNRFHPFWWGQCVACLDSEQIPIIRSKHTGFRHLLQQSNYLQSGRPELLVSSRLSRRFEAQVAPAPAGQKTSVASIAQIWLMG
jgi:hypothetical protein